jgi:hypothetical protein
MMTILIVIYCLFALLNFALCEVLNRPIVFYILLVVSLMYFCLSFYVYSSSSKYNYAFILTWWTYFILTHRIIRRRFLKENHFEPILTKGISLDLKTGRRAYYGDYLFTVMLLIVPAFLSYITSIITTISR